MHALKKFSMVITFAALSLSGSAAWATDSFDATAELDGLNLVPPKLASVTAAFTLQATTTGGSIARATVLNPPRAKTRRPVNEVIDVSCKNMRLYFGQPFANGLPITTLCDEDIPKLKCKVTGGNVFSGPDPICEAREEFELHDIQFQKQQVAPFVGGFTRKIIARIELEFSDRRLPNNQGGLDALKALIDQGLIYVVMNSAFKARLGPDTDNNPETDEIIYTRPKRGIVVDGDLRGTLQIPSNNQVPQNNR